MRLRLRAASKAADRDQAVARTREMVRLQRAGRRDRWPPVLQGSTFILLSAAALTRLDDVSAQQWLALAVLLPVYVVAHRVGLDNEYGSFVPTEPVFVAMLFLVPLPLVPAAVLVACVLGAPPDPTPYHPLYKLFHQAMSGWFAVGPILVLAVADLGAPAWEHWPVYLAALAAQFVVDLAMGAMCCIAMRTSILTFVRSSGWSVVMDVLLAVAGFTAVVATGAQWWSAGLAAVPVLTMILVAHDNRAQIARAVAVADALEEAVEESHHDPLTTLPNRRRWDEALVEAQERQRLDGGLTVTAVMADIDGLKQANDTLGHQVGDEMIRAAAALLQRAAPADALVARLGGDEFGLLIVNAQPDTVDAKAVVEAIREVVRSREAIGGQQLSMSFGVASCPPLPTVEMAVAASDQQAMEEKRSRGRARGIARPRPRPSAEATRGRGSEPS
jgi:diguanylate cyclase (GGDEF)-like protein